MQQRQLELDGDDGATNSSSVLSDAEQHILQQLHRIVSDTMPSSPLLAEMTTSRHKKSYSSPSITGGAVEASTAASTFKEGVSSSDGDGVSRTEADQERPLWVRAVQDTRGLKPGHRNRTSAARPRRAHLRPKSASMGKPPTRGKSKGNPRQPRRPERSLLGAIEGVLAADMPDPDALAALRQLIASTHITDTAAATATRQRKGGGPSPHSVPRSPVRAGSVQTAQVRRRSGTTTHRPEAVGAAPSATAKTWRKHIDGAFGRPHAPKSRRTSHGLSAPWY